ncbi:MAG: hypothetical protein JST04_04285 [Bdellovibrionales bacterium]|nr:hypothetical protein [Bdellovibrionales bacterium]
MSLRIRNSLERADWAFAREVCALTGNAGHPIVDRSRWLFFGEQWVGPYERLRPTWSYVADEVSSTSGASERRLGYLTGSPDSTTFFAEKKWLFDLPLYLAASAGVFPRNGDVAAFRKRFRAEVFGPVADLGPRDHFPPADTRAVVAEYPAHLHINLIAAARGKGVGRLLVDRFRADLAAVGVHGIHLYCGDGPRAFYERIGFRVLDRIEFRPGFIVYRLGSRF